MKPGMLQKTKQQWPDLCWRFTAVHIISFCTYIHYVFGWYSPTPVLKGVELYSVTITSRLVSYQLKVDKGKLTAIASL